MQVKYALCSAVFHHIPLGQSRSCPLSCACQQCLLFLQRPRKKAKVESEDEEEDEEEEREEEAAESDSEDDLPLCTASKMPSDAELEQACLAILKGVDVINFSLKQLLAHLGELSCPTGQIIKKLP